MEWIVGLLDARCEAPAPQNLPASDFKLRHYRLLRMSALPMPSPPMDQAPAVPPYHGDGGHYHRFEDSQIP